MELYATTRALSNPIEIVPKVLSEGAISSRFNLGSDVNCGLDHGRSAPGRRSRNGKLPDDLSFQVYVRRIEGTICLYVYPLLNTGIPKKFLAALRINRSVVVVSIPLCSLRWPEKDGASWTDDLPCDRSVFPRSRSCAPVGGEPIDQNLARRG